MSDPKPGDTVICRINDGLIVYSYITCYESSEIFELVCQVEGGYLVKVPSHLRLKNSFEATTAKIKEYSIPKQFIDAELHFINDDRIVGIKAVRDGECCDRCKEFFPYAAKNSEGGFRCFLCSTYRHR